MIGLYLKICNARDDLRGKNHSAKIKIKEFRLESESSNSIKLGLPVNAWIPVKDEPNHEGSAFSFLKCLHCGHEDFNDNGIDVNQYACNGCDEMISVIQKCAPLP